MPLKRPLNPSAVAAADAQLAKKTGGRKLTMGPEDRALREEWVAAYKAAGGESVGGKDPKPPEPIKCSTLPCQKKPIQLVSQTFATSPTDRTRTKVGVGEEVDITVVPAKNVTWKLTGQGKISTKSGSKTTFTAHERASTATITATAPDGGTASITFNVIEPSDWTMKRRQGTNLKHTNGVPDNGFQATVFVHPNDVNFYRVQIRELDSTAVTFGCFDAPPNKGQKHGGYPAPDFASSDFTITMTNHTDADGSKVNMVDNIYSGFSSITANEANTNPKPNPPFTPGTISYPITFEWRVATGARKKFPTVQQIHVISANGTCVSSKGGHTEQSVFTDPTSTP